MPLIGTKTKRFALVETRKCLGTWAFVLPATSTALAVIVGLEHRRFDVDSVSATMVLVLAVLVGGCLIFLALATGHLEGGCTKSNAIGRP